MHRTPLITLGLLLFVAAGCLLAYLGYGRAAQSVCGNPPAPSHWKIHKVANIPGLGVGSAFLTPTSQHSLLLSVYTPAKYEGETEIYALSEAGLITNHTSVTGLPSTPQSQQPAPGGGMWSVSIAVDSSGKYYKLDSAVFQSPNGTRTQAPITPSEHVQPAWAPGCNRSLWITEGDWQEKGVIQNFAASGQALSTTTLPNSTNVEREGNGYGKGLITGIALVAGGEVCYSREFSSQIAGFKTFYGCLTGNGQVVEQPCPLGAEPRGPFVTGPDGAMWTLGRDEDAPRLVRVDSGANVKTIGLNPYLGGALINGTPLASLDGALWFVGGDAALYKVVFS